MADQPVGEVIIPGRAKLSDIKIEVDIDALTIGDLEDLETSQTAHQIMDWLEKNAKADRRQIRNLPLRQLRNLGKFVSSKLNEELAVPKAN